MTRYFMRDTPLVPSGAADDDPAQFQAQRSRPAPTRISLSGQRCRLPVLHELLSGKSLPVMRMHLLCAEKKNILNLTEEGYGEKE